ncbi:hypothetical protein EDF69_000291 [Sphingomonas sp. JUb134]|nr:hypothetical protein [Sphingomonas sp. JUb134]
MRLDRLHADIQDEADLLVDLTFGDQLDHFALPVGQSSLGSWRRLQKSFEERFRNHVREIRSPDRECVDRSQQMFLRIGLEDISACTSSQCVQREILTIMHGVDHDLDARKFQLQGDGEIEAI